ncbi:MAG: hypothetical protein SFX72_01895 [Isosphaeraceae bacterium]|nr:hypothetical protein [Isosphaeraceae bacterium]
MANPTPTSARPPRLDDAPVARPAIPIARAPIDFRNWRERFWTPAGKTGVGISVAVHLLLIVVLGLLVFTPPPSEIKTLDTSLEAGSPFGVEDGFEILGGLDAAGAMPEPIVEAVDPDSSVTLLSSESLSTDPTAGFLGNESGNPGAGDGQGFGLAKFGFGGEVVRGVTVKVGDPQFTLLWDQKVDLDLHVIEPGGKEISWLDQRGAKGGELDVDNREGLGPENIYWLTPGKGDERKPTLGPSGEYRWFVYYYRGFDGAPSPPVRWKVRIKAEGEVKVVQGRLTRVDEKSKEYSLTIPSSPNRPR